MVDSTEQEQGGAPEGAGGGEEKPPFMQRLLDNPFALLFIGVFMPAVLYLVWGVVEIAQVPLAK